MEKLKGKKILQIFINQENLRFVTDEGNIDYNVFGDCCSTSFFYDFYGVKNLLNNGKVENVQEVNLDDKVDAGGKIRLDNGELKVYGYQIITRSENFGEVTSVLSFRNESNGYYGGSIQETNLNNTDRMVELKDDITEVK